jgi:hypothetical protein
MIPPDMIDVKISYDNDNHVFQFSFVQGGNVFKIKCPAKDNNPNMQIYFNCRGGREKNTCIQIHEVIYDPHEMVEKVMPTMGKEMMSTVTSDTTNVDDIFPDYKQNAG